MKLKKIMNYRAEQKIKSTNKQKVKKTEHDLALKGHLTPYLTSDLILIVSKCF